MKPAVIRCAIYTRKSSEEGLEQDFNSLDAQREACAAYILSQASEGWTQLPEVYDDGGISGGTLARPALQRLLADVKAGRIDIIVVYKVDRLTRSLLDFSRLVEAFDASSTSFVSVTQSFNTTTSMGRLTLNMLLSFAQFEREVTAERIRDKIAASKARGMWMGGVPPLGYKPNGRSLAVVEPHADIVRHIFQRYLALGCVRLLEHELQREGVKVPVRTTQSGKAIGGGWFSRGLLHVMLRRVTYDGQIAHCDKVYAGNHPAIIERDTFVRVQAMLTAHKQGERQQTRIKAPSLLAGCIVDEAGDPLTPAHATKGKARYRYYVSRSLHRKESSTGVRIPAREIETLVTNRMAQLFDDPIELIALASLDVKAECIQRLHDGCTDIAARLRKADRETVMALLTQVRVADGRVELDCSTAGIADLVGIVDHVGVLPNITLVAEARLTRSGMAMKLVQADGAALATKPDITLTRQLITARRWWAELRQGEIDITRLAERERVTASYVTRIVRLAFLSPAVVEAIVAGKQRSGVDVGKLTHGMPMPACWHEQRRMLLPASTA